ncbi:MAG: hydrogenase iron-sulfur subunit [Candidatus Dormibacteria bacterium]
MTVQAGLTAVEGPPARSPRVLVFSTNSISDPGIDLAGSSHLHYSPEVVVISLPCTSGVRPGWILHALERGFDGVFIAADGEECGFLPDCTARSSRIVQAAQALMAERRIDGRRVKMAAICSVCAEPFARQVRGFTESLASLEG